MQDFALIRESMSTGGIYAPQCFEKFRRFNKINVCGLAVLMFYNILSLMSIICDAETMSEYSDGIFIFSGMLVLIGYFVILVVQTQETFIIIENVENIIQKRLNNPNSKNLYDTVSKNLKKWSRFIDLAIAKLSPIFLVVSAFIATVFAYFTGNLNEENIRMGLSFWFPFNWKSFPNGYLIAFCVELCGAIFIFGLVAAFTTSFVRICMFLLAIAKDIKQELGDLNEIDENNVNEKELEEKFCEIIQLHSDAIQCVNDFTDFIKFMLLMNFGFSLLTICTNLLMFDLEISKDVVEMYIVVNLLVKTLYSFILLFILCELGERLRLGFEEIGNEINNMNWYLFPIKIQRMIPTMQIMAQQDVQFIAFGNYPCSRENFKRIVNGGYSFFTIFRGLR